ncbi:lycopene cyclase family protein [Gordonia soli]|uniref:lycopene cyclase family protein n=1 Tax=Gordonia soli TaxID=320799 RepID=UPI000345657E|nr:lycopene cyclase family protein [Gordonia soli]
MEVGAPDRVVVVGAGPAGRALSHRLAHRGVAVTLIDPHPARPWRSTYACWSDELPDWLDPSVVSAEVDSVRVIGHRRTEVHRGYAVLDTDRLQETLSVVGDSPLVVCTAEAVAVAPDGVTLDDGRRIDGRVIIDARGVGGTGPRQTAWGIVVPTDVAAPVLDGASAILMDLRPADPTVTGLPSFLYAVPLDGDRVLLEETCLAGDPALPLSELRTRLAQRLSRTGIDPALATATEKVSFGLQGASRDPWHRRPTMFGARAGLMHPASGYSVAASLATADPLAAAISAGGDPTRTLWPHSARMVQRLRAAGLAVLLHLDADDTMRFFDDFFDLPVHRQRAYLSDRDDLRGLLAAMLTLFTATDRRLRRHLVRAAPHLVGR